MQITKASKAEIKARMGVVGPSGAGKTTMALATMKHLANRTIVIDTERGSSHRYAGLFDFDVIELEDFHPQNYMQAITIAVESGYDGLIIDSFSHAWYAALDLVERSSNNMVGWSKVRPLLRRLNDQMLKAPCHVIATMRSKTPWEKASSGKTVPSQGIATVQAKDIAYEFDIFGEMRDRALYITKSRCPGLQGKSFLSPGENVANIIKDWIGPGQERALLSPGENVVNIQDRASKSSPYKVCKTWGSPEGAIAWAAQELPHASIEELSVMWRDLEPDENNQKGKGWVDLVYQLKGAIEV